MVDTQPPRTANSDANRDAHQDDRPAGALLTDDQIRKLRIAVIVMSVALIAGVTTLIGRVLYLANRGGEQASPRGPVTAEPRLVLPAGATLKSTTLSGDRLLAQYSSPRGDGIMILDLGSGKVISHVRVETP